MQQAGQRLCRGPGDQQRRYQWSQRNRHERSDRIRRRIGDDVDDAGNQRRADCQ